MQEPRNLRPGAAYGSRGAVCPWLVTIRTSKDIEKEKLRCTDPNLLLFIFYSRSKPATGGTSTSLLINTIKKDLRLWHNLSYSAIQSNQLETKLRLK